MSDRRHVCAHVRFLGLYRSTDYSWDMTSRMPKLSSQRSAILPSTALPIWLSCHIQTFHLEYMYIFVHDFERRDSKLKKHGSVDLFTAGRSCRPPSLLSCYTNFSTDDVLLLREWIWYPLLINRQLLDNILEPIMNYTIPQLSILICLFWWIVFQICNLF